LYQHEETAVMDIVRGTLAEHGKTVLANIHEAIVVKQRISADLKYEIEWRMQEQTGNPYWQLGAKQVQRWHASAKEVKALEAAHRQRIAEEEAVAAGYKNQWVKSCADDDYDE
jgi:creatinine amidohydrolase/Fe(II)-dependent formamide hydrolase-like protein